MAEKEIGDEYVFDAGKYEIRLYTSGVVIYDDNDGTSVFARPADREEAIRLSIGLRRAARRIEQIGNTMGRGGR